MKNAMIDICVSASNLTSFKSDSKGVWEKVSPDLGKELKQSLVNAVADSNFAEKIKPICLALSSIAKVDLMRNEWTDCFEFFTQMSN